jgi:hypothetical protein
MPFGESKTQSLEPAHLAVLVRHKLLGPMVLSLGVLCLYYISNISKDWMGSRHRFHRIDALGLGIFVLSVVGVSALYRYMPQRQCALQACAWVVFR